MTTYDPYPINTIAPRAGSDTSPGTRRRTPIAVSEVLLAYVQDELAARATGIWL